MDKKTGYGFTFIVIVAAIAMAAVTLYGRTIRLNYIEQIHLQDGYLYYVDRESSEDLKIIRSNTVGRKGNVIICKKHDREKYRLVDQIFFDDEGQSYVLLEEINVETWDGISCKVYQCDFKRGKLLEPAYDLTQDAREYSKMIMQRIQGGRLYYVAIPDSESGFRVARLFSMDENGNKELLEEVPLEYPYLNAQFFLSRDNVLLWMDYVGEVHAKRIGTEDYLEIEGITGKQGVFKSLSDDGTGAYVLDYEQQCIRYIDLEKQTSYVIFSQADIQERSPEFEFRNLQSIDCTKDGFCAGVANEEGLFSVCSYENGFHQDLQEIVITYSAVCHCMIWVYIGILLAAVILCAYWLARVIYHFQTILVRLCLIFLLGLFVMDSFLEFWIGQSMRQQLRGNQITALSALGKILKEDIIYNIPGNDDGIRSVKLIVSKKSDAVDDANQGAEADYYAAEAEAEKVEETDEEA